MFVVCITTSKLLFMWFGPGWCCVSSAGALECHSIALTALMLLETTGSYKISVGAIRSFYTMPVTAYCADLTFSCSVTSNTFLICRVHCYCIYFGHKKVF